MRTAATLAAENDGEVLVMNVVTVPDQTPLSSGREQADERRDVLNRAMEVAEAADVPVSGTIRIGHHAADAILNTLVQHQSDAVLLGWQGRGTRRRDVVLGATVDRVVSEADCDVFVEKIGSDADGQVDSILLPSAGGPHAELAADVAAAISRGTGAIIHAVYIVPPDADAEQRQRGEALLKQLTADMENADINSRLLEHDDVVDGLAEEGAQHNLTVIGATREGIVQQFLFGAIPEAVGEQSPNTVIMTKQHLDVTSRLKQSFHKLRDRITGNRIALEEQEERR